MKLYRNSIYLHYESHFTLKMNYLYIKLTFQDMRRILFLSILLFINYLYCNASVIINEIMPKNISFHINSNFNFEGWIELYNNGNEDVDISTLFVSDDAKNPFKWQMPYDSTLNASEYILTPHSFNIFFLDKFD